MVLVQLSYHYAKHRGFSIYTDAADFLCAT